MRFPIFACAVIFGLSHRRARRTLFKDDFSLHFHQVYYPFLRACDKGSRALGAADMAFGDLVSGNYLNKLDYLPLYLLALWL